MLLPIPAAVLLRQLRLRIARVAPPTVAVWEDAAPRALPVGLPLLPTDVLLLGRQRNGHVKDVIGQRRCGILQLHWVGRPLLRELVLGRPSVGSTRAAHG